MYQATYSELRRSARLSLNGNWGKAIGGTLLLFAVILAVYFIPFIGLIVAIASPLITGAIVLGLSSFYMGIARGEIIYVSEVFSGFGDFWRAMRLYLLVLMFTLLWTLLFYIPGIIAGYRYSMSFMILRDNPEIGAMEAIRRSKQLMAGNKFRLFVLQLTFLGWRILGMLTLGIGYIWLIPYEAITTVHFYDDLLGKGRNQTPPPLEPFNYDLTKPSM
ncbi:DUF975 family protein [Paenibacillus kobensis]|uniref:DUF975 family protein n=1 Tax=Paenibacillus kobensis TaxID=59841 RepID=UPI000FD6E247|nr:DUF975 family protein [Paenibacillus kobensis]